jgi:hypothetical protein
MNFFFISLLLLINFDVDKILSMTLYRTLSGDWIFLQKSRIFYGFFLKANSSTINEQRKRIKLCDNTSCTSLLQLLAVVLGV